MKFLALLTFVFLFHNYAFSYQIKLEKVIDLVKERGWRVINLDAVVVAERPKLKPHIDLMRSNIADTIGIANDLVGVKATTNESLGPEGREEGISSYAVVLLERI